MSFLDDSRQKINDVIFGSIYRTRSSCGAGEQYRLKERSRRNRKLSLSQPLLLLLVVVVSQLLFAGTKSPNLSSWRVTSLPPIIELCQSSSSNGLSCWSVELKNLLIRKNKDPIRTHTRNIPIFEDWRRKTTFFRN